MKLFQMILIGKYQNSNKIITPEKIQFLGQMKAFKLITVINIIFNSSNKIQVYKMILIEKLELRARNKKET